MRDFECCTWLGFVLDRRGKYMAPIVTHLMPIEQVTEAFELSESREDEVVKVALTC